MSEIIISGGKRLEGAVHVHGAKNSVLPILAATILSGSVSVIHNCPRLSDVDATVAILEHLGCRVSREGQTVTVDSSTLDRCDIPDHLMRELGPRPIDLHLAALRRLGADIREKGGDLRCRTKGLRGTEISLTIPSVGATENAMLAACGAKGETVIYNAAREPEIVDLQQFLNACGARVRGAGSSAVVVEGGIPLHMAEYTVMADRICAATYLSAAAIAGGEIEVEGVPRSQLVLITDLFSAAGCRIRAEERRIWLESDGRLRSVPPVRTAPYPGFPTDAQPPVMAALTKARGTTVFVETMFENRYRHTQELVRMGADIRVEGRVAVVCGAEKLHGANLEAADLRGGAALVVAALGAEGESRISGLHHIDRGYADLTERLAALGGAIYRN